MAKKYPLGYRHEIILRIVEHYPYGGRTEPFEHPKYGWMHNGVNVAWCDYLQVQGERREDVPTLEVGDKIKLICARVEKRATGPRRNRFFGRRGAKVNPKATLDEPVKSRIGWIYQWEYIGVEHEDLYGSGYEGYED
jgi:hypothetical protein